MSKLFINKEFFSILLILFTLTGFSQDEDERINPENFSIQLMEKLITAKINDYRSKNGMDTLFYAEALYSAAKDQADFMYRTQKLDLEQPIAVKMTTSKRIIFFGGSGKGEEIILAIPISKGKQFTTYNAIAEDIFKKIVSIKKYGILISTPVLYYGSLALTFDKENKKIWLSIVLANPSTIAAKNVLGIKNPDKFTRKRYSVLPTDIKECKSCDKFDDLQGIQKGLRLEKGKVYLDYANLKKLQKLLKGELDGLSVDVIQRSQFPCNGENIKDPNLFSKGIMLKPRFSQKLFRGNIYTDVKENKFSGYVGKIKRKYLKRIGNEYELNAIIVLNNHFCRNVNRAYIEEGDVPAFAPLSMVPDTSQENDSKRFKPTRESNTIIFTIPFEQNKSRYDIKDIKPFLDSVDNAVFIIDEISIVASSSIEGDSVANAVLQRRRAESIVSAVEKTQSKKLVKEIKTSDSWEMFKEQVKGTVFDDMGKKTKEEVKKMLRGQELLKKMEPILSKQRFATITLKVTYDINGANEQPYVLSSLRKITEKKDAAQSLRIQRYVISQIMSNRYDYKKLLDIQFPKEGAFSSLNINQLWLETKFIHRDTLSNSIINKLEEWYRIAPQNDFVVYNKLMKSVMAENISEVTIKGMQTNIDALYSKDKIPHSLIDALNLELQFKIIALLDTSETEGAKTNLMVTQSMETIKKIFKIEGTDWQTGLKLAYIFVRHNDKDFALKSLSKFINEGINIDEELAFTYVSIASHFPDRVGDRLFRIAMTAAKQKNLKRYCKLFGTPKLSFQLLENPMVKEEYCKNCEVK